MSSELFDVQGMTCAHCEHAVTQAVLALDPEAHVEVDLASGRVEVGGGLTREAVTQAIEQAGYSVGASAG